MGMQKLRVLLLALVAGLSTFSGVAPAGAFDRGDIKISPLIGQVENSYPGIAGVRPHTCDTPTVCSRPYAQTQYPGCRQHNGAYCDAIRLEIERPEGYMDDLYEVWIDLVYERGVTNNKMDLYVFQEHDETDVVLGPSVVDNRTDTAPKSVRIGAPEPGALQITVVNERGVNNGYKLRVRWVEVDLGPTFDTSTDAGTVPSVDGTNLEFKNTGSGPVLDDSTPIGFPDGAPERRATRKVMVPGADGELRAIEMPVVTRADRTAGASTGVSTALVFLVMVLMTSAAGVGFLALRAKRQRV